MKNILKMLLGVMLAVSVCVIAYPIYVAFTGGTDQAVETAIGFNLYWGYFLFAFVVLAAVIGSVYGMAKASSGLLKTVLSFVGVAVVVVGSYLYASGHTIEIMNIEHGVPFGSMETVITESSVIIAYIAMAGAIVAALVSEAMGAFK